MANVNLESVRKFMSEKNLTEAGLAEIMGVSYSYLFRVMRGGRKAGGKFIEGLIKAGLKTEDIFLPSVLPKGNTSPKDIDQSLGTLNNPN